MQTERVTFLTTPGHKAALDAFARESGMSVGHVVREATSRYVAETAFEDEEEALAALVAEVNLSLPKIHKAIDSMIDTLDRTHAKVDAALRTMGVRS